LELNVHALLHQYHPAQGDTFVAKIGFASFEVKIPRVYVIVLAVDGFELREVPVEMMLGVPSWAWSI
jgi:hypothetical protein